MSVTPTSSAALAVAGAKDLIAKSTIFQNYIEQIHPETGASEANAKAHIFADNLFDPSKEHAEDRPFVLTTLDIHEFESIAQCSIRRLAANGSILVGFIDNARKTDVGGDDDHDDSYLEFLNWCYGTIDDLSNLGLLGADTNYPFTGIETLQPPMRSDLAERVNDDFWTCWLLFQHERGG